MVTQALPRILIALIADTDLETSALLLELTDPEPPGPPPHVPQSLPHEVSSLLSNLSPIIN